MRTLRGVVLTLCALLFCLTVVSSSKADTWNKKTIVRFNDVVQVPGQVLHPGTYVFRLADSNSNRHIVQIWNRNENRLLATILAIPAERLEVRDNSVFELEERPGDSPMALKYWFYPGDSIGQEFAYSFHRASYYRASNKNSRHARHRALRQARSS